ncbi:MAG: hypothetical protein FJY11_02955, partial [Bacteroidetes bacterium]|nr:hypothetical protein [Bacteroidota bacterium]
MKSIISPENRTSLLDRFHYTSETKNIIENEDLLPVGLLSRLHAAFPQYSGFREKEPFHFSERKHYSGIEG